MMYVTGEAVAKNLNLAATYFDQGCTLGNYLSRIGLGGLFESGEGVPQDLAHAITCIS